MSLKGFARAFLIRPASFEGHCQFEELSCSATSNTPLPLNSQNRPTCLKARTKASFYYHHTAQLHTQVFFCRSRLTGTQLSWAIFWCGCRQACLRWLYWSSYWLFSLRSLRSCEAIQRIDRCRRPAYSSPKPAFQVRISAGHLLPSW